MEDPRKLFRVIFVSFQINGVGFTFVLLLVFQGRGV